MPAISVIIPVYNTPEAYLKRCLESICNQTYKDIELILVDDGSKEQCAYFCDSCSALDYRLAVIHKENGGVSSARNKGIELASGDYIMFVDPDDTLAHEKCLERAVEVAQESGADIVCARVSYKFLNKSFEYPFKGFEDLIYLQGSELEKLEEYFFSFHYPKNVNFPNNIPRGPVAKLYKRSLLSSVSFDPLLTYAEDGIFNSTVVSLSSSVLLVDEVWYDYYQYKKSAVHSGKMQTCERHCKEIEEYIQKDSPIYWAHRFHILKEVVMGELRNVDIKGIFKVRSFLSGDWANESIANFDDSKYLLSKQDAILLSLLRKGKLLSYCFCILFGFVLMKFRSKRLIG